jgi:hypothetical protein
MKDGRIQGGLSIRLGNGEARFPFFPILVLNSPDADLKGMRKQALLLMLAAIVLSGCAKKVATAQDDLDRKFQEMMNGATLVGRSTRMNNDKVYGEEKYVIESVSKLTGETWLFRTRMQYNGHDIPLPLPVTIKWAGDTPVITLTDLSIPGMGSYTARVILYRDQYAGTWSGKNVGGQIFGKIVRKAENANQR